MTLQGLVVSVQYDDLLELTLPHNAPHFERIVVVTAPFDARSQAVARQFPNVELFVTDAFYQEGATFNKGLAVELARQRLANDCWTVFFDADIVMPPSMATLGERDLDPQTLYSPRRLDCVTPEQYILALATPAWEACGIPVIPDGEQAGYFQLFHPRAAALRSRPWYGVRWKHAGGCDSEFMRRFPRSRRKWLPFRVLHLGVERANWHGRNTPRWSDEPASPGPIDPDLARRLQTAMFDTRKVQRGFHGERLAAADYRPVPRRR